MMNLFLVVTSNQYQKTKREQNLHLNHYLANPDENSSWENFLMFVIHLGQKTLNKIVKLFQKDNMVNYFFIRLTFFFVIY
jgi:hypothetical protein